MRVLAGSCTQNSTPFHIFSFFMKTHNGAGSGKLAIIITTDGYATAKKIDEETGRGATLIKAIGTYSGIERHLILCACGKAEIFKVRNAAHAVDPNAFVMITEASEVFGEGFTPPELDQ